MNSRKWLVWTGIKNIINLCILLIQLRLIMHFACPFRNRSWPLPVSEIPQIFGQHPGTAAVQKKSRAAECLLLLLMKHIVYGLCTVECTACKLIKLYFEMCGFQSCFYKNLFIWRMELDWLRVDLAFSLPSLHVFQLPVQYFVYFACHINFLSVDCIQCIFYVQPKHIQFSTLYYLLPLDLAWFYHNQLH